MGKAASKPGITLSEAARRIGIHPATLKRWIEDGEGPPALIKRGHAKDTIRIQPTKLEDWIERNSRGSR